MMRLRYRSSQRVAGLRARGGERGSGAILGLALMASVVLLAGMLVPVALALAVKQRVESAADAAALAAADTASGRVAGYPCRTAARLAEQNGAILAECSVVGLIATVSAEAHYLGFVVGARARAGPPGSQRSVEDG